MLGLLCRVENLRIKILNNKKVVKIIGTYHTVPVHIQSVNSA
jgi:hypothetical protein